MPGDNSATVALGAGVEFPQDGPSNGIVTRIDASTFLITATGTYLVQFQVSVSEAGQLQLELNGGVPLANTVVGRATGTSQIVGVSIQTLTAGDTIEVINPAGNSTALTITPLAGGTVSVSAHLTIVQLA
jgi:hypothetical protein